MFAISDQFDWSLPQPQVGNKLFWERHTFPIGQNEHDSIINWPFINLLPGGHCLSTVRQPGKPDLHGTTGGIEPEPVGTVVQLIQETVTNDSVFESKLLVQMSRLKVYQLPFLKAAPAEACQAVLFPQLNGPAPNRSRSKLSAPGKNCFTRNDEMLFLYHEVMLLSVLSRILAVANLP